MWPFASRGSRSAAIAPGPKDVPPMEQFENNDAVMKVWLPQTLSERVNWLSIHSETSRPDVLRALMYEHVYGRVAYEILKSAAAKKRATPSGDSDIKQSRARYTDVDLEYLGKSLDDFKLHLPARLKTDLASIAKQHGLTPSSYARKLLVQQLLGERVHTNWQAAVGKISPEVELLERDAGAG